MRAPDFLRAGLKHMDDRASIYDKPQGERSMGTNVALFNILIADKLKQPLSEEDGWNFMELLKLVRSKQGGFREDSYEDRAAYAGLAGEAGFRERKGVSGAEPGVVFDVEREDVGSLRLAYMTLMNKHQALLASCEHNPQSALP